MDENISENIQQEEPAQTSTNVPLFIKKLWKMVNDTDAGNIISWNTKGDGIIIHDQVQFITKLLPQYFKHNNMASFVRQLNFYNFHKVPSLNNDIHFAHECFIKDMPEVLHFIRRKHPVLKPKTLPSYKDQEVQELLKDVKDLKGKHTLVDRELDVLKQENLTLWNELNSLRVKYTKQSTIINMLIHFLITYIHSHQTTFSKSNMEVSTNQHSGNNNIKVGPPLLEIGYKNSKKVPSKNPCTVFQPGTSNSVTYSLKLPENCRPEVKRPCKTQRMNEMLSMDDQEEFPRTNVKKSRSGITYSIELPGQTEKFSQSHIKRSLLDILKENEHLCEEETDDLLTHMTAKGDSLVDVEEEPQYFIEDTTMEHSPSFVGYTVTHPSESTQEVLSPEIEHIVSSPQPVPLVESPQESTVGMNPQEFAYGASHIVKKEIPIETALGTTSYAITYPKLQNYKQDFKKPKANIIDHLILPSVAKNAASNKIGTSSKLIKKPTKIVKTVNNATCAARKTNMNKMPPQKTSKLKLTKTPTQCDNIANAEGTLLEILKENEKLTNDVVSKTNLDKLIDDPIIDQGFEAYMEDTGDVNLLESDVQSQSTLDSQPQLQNTLRDTNDTYNILENPKEQLSTYIDNTQEEIDMLQSILNSLTSKDLSEIINNQQSPTSIDDVPIGEENLDDEHVPEVEPATECNNTNMNEYVDKYFRKHFLA